MAQPMTSIAGQCRLRNCPPTFQSIETLPFVTWICWNFYFFVQLLQKRVGFRELRSQTSYTFHCGSAPGPRWKTQTFLCPTAKCCMSAPLSRLTDWFPFMALLGNITELVLNIPIIKSLFTHSHTSRPSSMTVGDSRWPLYCLSSPLLPVLLHLLQLNVATTTPLFYVVHPLSFGSSLVT